MTTAPIHLSPNLQHISFKLGAANGTTVKVEAVSRNLFEKIWNGITHGIRAFFGIGIQERADCFALAHALKNQGFMNQAEFFVFQEAYDKGGSETTQVFKDICKRLYEHKIIDRKHFFTLALLIHNGRFKEALNTLYGLASVQHIHTFKNQLQVMISAEEHNRLIDLLSYTYETGVFEKSDIEFLNRLRARVEVMKWAQSEGEGEVVDAIRANDESLFSQKLEEKIGLKFSTFSAFKEALRSLDFLKGIYEEIKGIDLTDIQETYDRFLIKEMGFLPIHLFQEMLKKLDSAHQDKSEAVPSVSQINAFAYEPLHKNIEDLTEIASAVVSKPIPETTIRGHRVLNGNLEWVELKEHQAKESLFTLRMLSKQSNDEMTNSYLDYLIGVYGEDFKKGLRVLKKSPIFIEMSKVDRKLNAPHYKTEIAKKQLEKWVNEKTAYARDHGDASAIESGKNCTILNQEIAKKTFEIHPEQYDWIVQMRLHRCASTFNHEWLANEAGEVLIPTPDGAKPASLFMSMGLRSINGRMINMNTGVEYTYDQTGLHIIDPNDTFKPFKTKDRKTKDWRLEIATDSGFDPETGSQVHSYLYLKTPTGQVYSIGKFWDPDIANTGLMEHLMAMPAEIVLGDHHDFMARKKSNKDLQANIKVTKIDLGKGEVGEANFNKAMEFIKNYKTCFQITGSNCGTLPLDTAALFGIYPKSKVTPISYMLPLSIGQRKFLTQNGWIQTLSMILLYPLKLIFNIAFIALGALKIHPLAEKDQTNLFPTIGRFLDPRSTLIDFPPQLRAWQEVLQEKKGNKVFSLEELSN